MGKLLRVEEGRVLYHIWLAGEKDDILPHVYVSLGVTFNSNVTSIYLKEKHSMA